MLLNRSPQKENRSPSPQKNQPLKNNPKTQFVIQELKQLLKSHNILIPQHLANDTEENGMHFMKLFDAVDPQEFAKVKARLGDKEFEVKRLEEDFAQFKLLSRLQNDKTMRKLKDQLNTLKLKLNEENKKWEVKFAETTQRFEDQGQSFRKNTEEHYKDLQQQEITHLKQQYYQQINSLTQQLSDQKQKYEELVQNMKKEHDQKMNNIAVSHQKQVETLTLQHTEQIQKTQQKCESMVLSIECEKLAEVKQTEQVKQNTVKKEEKYLKQIGILERDKNNLFEKLDNTQMRLKVMQKKYEDLVRQMENLKNSHQLELAEIDNELRRVQHQTGDSIDSQRLKILKEHYEKTQTLQKRLQNLEKIKDTIINQYKGNQMTLDRKFERRLSRKQDVEIIKEIQYKLAEKEREATQLYNNLKYFQLQKQNNDKIYTKIFAASKEKKGASYRHDRDIYSILKQSHTTDVRHMLKITTKDPNEFRK